ncbi:alpha/beta hydrolase [Leadbettera azotonutricia]|uniref:Putative Kmt1 n=1 Tax=Leadbettera azotonutricia (strain ATCC BAA-888 / DSM 13862 / ZAS-9) TaxID=545695 RepID=F5YC38_LEAAZ|nr:dienelactone hydrolase family protein [Leadbettera azotonutricia]AEF82311.1 putative Kmt1 [Leadbettera azotonutricia ZAS-9]
MKKPAKPLIAFCACILVVILSMCFAALVQTGFGKIRVSTGSFENMAGGVPGSIAYKLYVPAGADKDHPVPAVLVMHGYQNDKETSAAYGIELARRGIAALSVDLYGHGDNSLGMRFRGWGKAKLTNLDKKVSGPQRFLIMMTFSILDFFKPAISEGVKDSSMGGKDAYRYLQSLDFVDPGRIGITGHSMGTWASWSTGAAFPGHKAIVLQCGELLSPDYYDAAANKFNNVLLLQARYDEFDYFRDYQKNVIGLEKTPLRYRDFMGQTSPVEWNRTYGSFADGTARRMELLQTNHRLATHDGHALTTAMYWFTNALDVKPSLADSNHIYMIKEVLALLAMLAALASMLPLCLLFARLPFFAPIVQGLETSNLKLVSPKGRRKVAIIAILVSGLTFPFLGQLGHGLMPVPENIFRMTIGNGFITWLTFLMLVSLFMLLHWYKKGEGKRIGATLYDLGLGDKAAPDRLNWQVIGKSVLLAFILTGIMYILVCVCVTVFQLDFRFIWPFFRPFTFNRLGQFFVYLPFYAAFFTVNAGVRLYGQLRLPEKSSPAKTQLAWWGYSVFIMLGGVFLIVLIEYIPFFLGFGPGADLLFSSLFGGPFMSVMILLIPQFAVFFFLSTWLYRKTGRIYLGSFIVAILASWVLAGGSAMF